MGRAVVWVGFALLCALGASWLLFSAGWRESHEDRIEPIASSGEASDPELSAAGTKPPGADDELDPRWLLAELQSEDPERQDAAYTRAARRETLRYDEDLARFLIPLLASLDRQRLLWANVILRRMGAAVVPVLDAYYDSEVGTLRRQALLLLMFSGESGSAWMRPRATALLEDEDPDVARAALTVVCSGMPYDERLAQYLLSRMQPSDRADYNGPEKALARMGPEGIAHLLAILDDPRSELRMNALRGLVFARPGDLEPHLARLAQVIVSDEEDERVAAIRALAAMQGDCEACLPALVESVGDESISVQQAALDILEQMGERSAEAVPILLSLLGGDDDRVVERVARLLHTTLLDPKRAMPALAAALHGDAGESVAEALAAYGPDALPFALKVFETGADDARYAALLALGRFGPASREIAPALPALIRSDDYDLARRAMDVAGRIGPEAAVVVPAVLECLWAGDVITPGQAASVLMRLGSAAQAPLRKALTSNEADRRRTAVEVLTACWGSSGFALEELGALLGADDAHLRYLAAKAIQVSLWSAPESAHMMVFGSAVDPSADPTLRVRVRTLMERAAEDPARSVRDLARKTIANLDRLGQKPAK